LKKIIEEKEGEIIELKSQISNQNNENMKELITFK
jgi:hypothetical protein